MTAAVRIAVNAGLWLLSYLAACAAATIGVALALFTLGLILGGDGAAALWGSVFMWLIVFAYIVVMAAPFTLATSLTVAALGARPSTIAAGALGGAVGASSVLALLLTVAGPEAAFGMLYGGLTIGLAAVMTIGGVAGGVVFRTLRVGILRPR